MVYVRCSEHFNVTPFILSFFFCPLAALIILRGSIYGGKESTAPSCHQSHTATSTGSKGIAAHILGGISSQVFMINKFYKSKAWEHKRAAILRRDNYQCQRCKRYGRLRQAQTVHHIKHYDEYPELALDSSNLISLCNDCHNAMHPEKAEKANKSRKQTYY